MEWISDCGSYGANWEIKALIAFSMMPLGIRLCTSRAMHFSQHNLVKRSTPRLLMVQAGKVR
jgi:hypothetical protein